jgi:hypothetical protein
MLAHEIRRKYLEFIQEREREHGTIKSRDYEPEYAVLSQEKEYDDHCSCRL